MKARRAFFARLGGLIAATFIGRLVPGATAATAPGLVGEPAVRSAVAATVVFTVRGWGGGETGDDETAGQRVVPLHLPASWRSSWL